MKMVDNQCTLEYKGYSGYVHFDTDDNIYNGWILDISDMVFFCALKESEIEKEFHNAVDDYVEFKKECGRDD